MAGARWKPNVTVAAVVGRPRPDGALEWLLVEEETQAGLRLNNPAGHLDPGETLVQAVVREALEETARAFVPERVVGVYLAPSASDSGTTYLRFAFAGRVGEADPGRALDAGIVRTLWMSTDEVRASRDRHRTPALLRGIEDALAGHGFPLERLASIGSES
jgi:8-oxo-dGTP pyrophosphatase MutT (NUDIX family)